MQSLNLSGLLNYAIGVIIAKTPKRKEKIQMKIVQELLLFTLYSYIGMYVVLGIHELAHLLTAKALKIRSVYIRVGFGPSVMFKVGRQTVVLGLIPLAGVVRLHDYKTKFPLWKTACITLAGPIISVVAGLVFYAFLTNYATLQSMLVSLFGLLRELPALCVFLFTNENIPPLTLEFLTTYVGLTFSALMVAKFVAILSFASGVSMFIPIPPNDGAHVVIALVGKWTKQNLGNFQEAFGLYVMAFLYIVMALKLAYHAYQLVVFYYTTF